MHFSSEVIKDFIVILRPTGFIDLTAAVLFEKTLDALRESYSKHHFIIDLGRVEYLSSSALRVIITTCRKLEDKNFNLVLLNPTSYCSKIMKVIKFDDIVDVYTSEEDAINSFLII